MAKKTFLGFGNRYLWDSETNSNIARFINFKCETEDPKAIAFLEGKGYKEVDEVEFAFWSQLHPKAIASLTAKKLREGISILNLPNVDKKKYAAVGIKQEELAQVMIEAYQTLR